MFFINYYSYLRTRRRPRRWSRKDPRPACDGSGRTFNTRFGEATESKATLRLRQAKRTGGGATGFARLYVCAAIKASLRARGGAEPPHTRRALHERRESHITAAISWSMLITQWVSNVSMRPWHLPCGCTNG